MIIEKFQCNATSDSNLIKPSSKKDYFSNFKKSKITEMKKPVQVSANFPFEKSECSSIPDQKKDLLFQFKIPKAFEKNIKNMQVSSKSPLEKLECNSHPDRNLCYLHPEQNPYFPHPVQNSYHQYPVPNSYQPQRVQNSCMSMKKNRSFSVNNFKIRDNQKKKQDIMEQSIVKEPSTSFITKREIFLKKNFMPLQRDDRKSFSVSNRYFSKKDSVKQDEEKKFEEIQKPLPAFYKYLNNKKKDCESKFQQEKQEKKFVCDPRLSMISHSKTKPEKFKKPTPSIVPSTLDASLADYVSDSRLSMITHSKKNPEKFKKPTPSIVPSTHEDDFSDPRLSMISHSKTKSEKFKKPTPSIVPSTLDYEKMFKEDILFIGIDETDIEDN